jgi:hypothetical protein
VNRLVHARRTERDARDDEDRHEKNLTDKSDFPVDIYVSMTYV